MKQILLFTILLFTFALTAKAQTSECPSGLVCLTREAAVEALHTADERDALKLELKVVKDEITKKDFQITDLLAKYSVAVQKAADYEKENITLNSRLDFYMKARRIKKFGIINF